MTAQEFATGLREIADWYEAHPETALPYDDGNGCLKVYGEPETKERAAAIARALGSAAKKYDAATPFFRLVGRFNGVGLCFVFNRESVCTARVVGVKVVPATPAVEAQPERAEDILEWDCHPILSEQKS